MLTFITTTIAKYKSLSLEQQRAHETIYLCRDEKTNHHQLYVGGLCFGENLNEEELNNRITALETLVNTKVDKVKGYSLISDSELNRLQKVHNYDDSVIRTLLARLQEQVNDIESQGYDPTDLKNEIKNTYATLLSLNETNTNVTILNNRIATMSNNVTNNTNAINEIKNDLDDKVDESQLDGIRSAIDALEDQIGDKLSSAMHYKGTVNTYQDLPKNANVGDMYNIATAGVDANGNKFNAGVNAAYSETGWDILAYPVDMTNYYSINDIATTADIDAFLK